MEFKLARERRRWGGKEVSERIPHRASDFSDEVSARIRANRFAVEALSLCLKALIQSCRWVRRRYQPGPLRQDLSAPYTGSPAPRAQLISNLLCAGRGSAIDAFDCEPAVAEPRGAIIGDTASRDRFRELPGDLSGGVRVAALHPVAARIPEQLPGLDTFAPGLLLVVGRQRRLLLWRSVENRHARQFDLEIAVRDGPCTVLRRCLLFDPDRRRRLRLCTHDRRRGYYTSDRNRKSCEPKRPPLS
jgi:hypothetical protein